MLGVAALLPECRISRAHQFQNRGGLVAETLVRVSVDGGIGGCGPVAQNRKGHYRAGHYVKPSSASSRWKKPSAGVVLVAVLLAIAGWNTLFGDDSDRPDAPRPQPSVSSTPAVGGQ